MANTTVVVCEELDAASGRASAWMRQMERSVTAARADAAWHRGQADEHLRRKKHAQLVTAEMAGTVRLVRGAVEAWQLGEWSAERALQEINDLVEKS